MEAVLHEMTRLRGEIGGERRVELCERVVACGFHVVAAFRMMS